MCGGEHYPEFMLLGHFNWIGVGAVIRGFKTEVRWGKIVGMGFCKCDCVNLDVIYIDENKFPTTAGQIKLPQHLLWIGPLRKWHLIPSTLARWKYWRFTDVFLCRFYFIYSVGNSRKCNHELFRPAVPKLEGELWVTKWSFIRWRRKQKSIFFSCHYYKI